MEAQASSELKGSIRLGNYLRQLRSGYGYSLRRVEERARAEGGEIDNSQLSRYEKGICYPSFDKLRVLANVFNVSVQAFSDVVDLESFEALEPAASDPVELTEEGNAALHRGETGRAFASYEKSVRILQRAPANPARDERLAQARVNLGAALMRLGKLALAEQELKAALRLPSGLNALVKARALLNLANVHASQGDSVLAEIEAERALDLARAHGLDSFVSARALQTLARVLAVSGRHVAAIDRYREAVVLYESREEPQEAVRIRINIAECYVSMGKLREGIRLHRAALEEARAGGFRYLEALGLSGLGEAYFRHGEYPRAQACFSRSDALSSAAEPRYTDLMFLNAFYEWKAAGMQSNPTREKIAFGRLKALRASLERRFPEVDVFDSYVEGGRSHA